MALTDFNHTTISTVDKRGDIDVHYYKNTSQDVQIEQDVLDSNPNIPATNHDLLSVLKNLSPFTFADKLPAKNINVLHATQDNQIFDSYRIDTLEDLIKILGTNAFKKNIDTSQVEIVVSDNMAEIIGSRPKTLRELIQLFGPCAMSKVLYVHDIELSDDAASNKNLYPRDERNLSTILSNFTNNATKAQYITLDKTATGDKTNGTETYSVTITDTSNIYYDSPNLYLMVLTRYGVAQYYDIFISNMSKGSYFSLFSNLKEFNDGKNRITTSLVYVIINEYDDNPVVVNIKIRAI